MVVGVVEIVRPFGCACAGADLGSGRIVVVVAVLVVVFSEQGIEQGGIGAAHALLHLDEVTLLLLGLLASGDACVCRRQANRFTFAVLGVLLPTAAFVSALAAIGFCVFLVLPPFSPSERALLHRQWRESVLLEHVKESVRRRISHGSTTLAHGAPSCARAADSGGSRRRAMAGGSTGAQ